MMDKIYKEKLIVLLEGLECQNIEALIEKSPEHLRTIGIEIAKHAKVGAQSDLSTIENEYNEIARRDFEREIYEQCDREDRKKK